MTCIIVDDEPLARAGMAMNIEKITSLELIGAFGNAMAAQDFLKDNPTDLILLDINMPELSGLDFAKSMLSRPLIIFITAYSEFAVDSYELDAVDYLLKPVSFERFEKAIIKAEQYLRMVQTETNDNQIESIEEDFIFIRADKKFFKIYFKDILFIKGLKDYVVIHTSDKKLITAMNIRTIGNQLPARMFMRVSKSYIINNLHIISFDTDFIYIGSEEIPLGISYREAFLEQYVKNRIVKR